MRGLLIDCPEHGRAEAWSEDRRYGGKAGTCKQCNRERATESDKLSDRAQRLAFGDRGGVKPWRKKWAQLSREAKDYWRKAAADTSGYTPERRKEVNASRRTIDGRRGYPPRKPVEKTYVNPMTGGTKWVEGTYKRKVRPSQKPWAKAVKRRDQMCVVTGRPVDAPIRSHGKDLWTVEAAHLVPLARIEELKLPKEWEFDDNNGVTLSCAAHAALDCAEWTVDRDQRVLRGPWVTIELPEFLLVKQTPLQMDYWDEHYHWAHGEWGRDAFS